MTPERDASEAEDEEDEEDEDEDEEDEEDEEDGEEDGEEDDNAPLPAVPNKVSKTATKQGGVKWTTTGADVTIINQQASRRQPQLVVPTGRNAKTVPRKAYFLLFFPLLLSIVM